MNNMCLVHIVNTCSKHGVYIESYAVATYRMYEDSGDLRGDLMHDLGGGVFQRVLQVVFEVAEEFPGSSLHHIQQSSAITGIHIWRQGTFSQSESRGKQNRHRERHGWIPTETDFTSVMNV